MSDGRISDDACSGFVAMSLLVGQDVDATLRARAAADLHEGASPQRARALARELAALVVDVAALELNLPVRDEP
jgi:hypothetical protein